MGQGSGKLVRSTVLVRDLILAFFRCDYVEEL